MDVLINNLGIYEAVGFFDESDEAWQRLFEVNIMSGVRLARHYLKGMLDAKSWGKQPVRIAVARLDVGDPGMLLFAAFAARQMADDANASAAAAIGSW